jgi:hypothetical protein
MADQPIVVPIQLDALVVNQGVIANNVFRWWQFSYPSLEHYLSPEPAPVPFDRSIGGQKAGVYLHWTLPDALRHGTQDARAGGSVYPLVPNRWLIVRMSGTTDRQATAWVVESDCPFGPRVTTVDSSQTSLYLADPDLIRLWNSSGDPIRSSTGLNPTTTTVQTARLGVRFPLAGWSERAAKAMFLTAVAPSNPLFSIYVPHNLGVFSFYDDLNGIDGGTLSYFLFGWFSDPTKDIMASWPADKASPQPYDALLKRLGWAVIGGSDSQATGSVYQGMVHNIAWDRRGTPPKDDPLQAVRDTGKLNVAIGNTTVDAFTALIKKQLDDPRKAELLRAFQYDFLQQLNQVNGEALLDEKIRQAWFGSKAGGYTWTIVEQSSDGTTGTNLTRDEADWLLRLNQDQAALDAALTTLYSLQWDLHSLWLRNGYLADRSNVLFGAPDGIPDPPGLAAFQTQLATQLDPRQTGSVAARLVEQFDTVRALLPRVPRPIPQESNAQRAFQDGIQAFARTKNLDPTKSLKAVAASRYWRANNPVVILSGVEPAPSAVSPNALPVRLANHVVTGFNVPGGTSVGVSAVADLVAATSLSAIASSAVLPLLQEFLLLDPANATHIATATHQATARVTAALTAIDPANFQGALPGLGLEPWGQPWNPMFLEWSTKYTYVPFSTGAMSWWTFDGTDYVFTPGAASPPIETRDIAGISLLSPHARFVFGTRLHAFVQSFGSETELAQIDDWVQKVYDWKFLAQELTGFSELMGLRDTRAFRRPAVADTLDGLPVAALTGYGDGVIPPNLALPDPYQGHVNTLPFFPNGPAIPFHGTRQGDLYFTDLFMYDKFGRTLFAIQGTHGSGLFDYTNFPLLTDEALKPDRPMVIGVNGVARLPPRLLQHARLDMKLLDASADTKIFGLDPGVLPIAGWVLPDHLDNSILVYGPDGRSLGEFRLLVDETGRKTGQWQAPPHSNLTLADVRTAAPHLYDMLNSPGIQNEAGFQAFLASIDETLWTTDPLGNRVDQNLSVLVGRPLALLRVRLRFQLDGDPINDTGWAATFKSDPPEFLHYQFFIRLGDQATRDDGLIGYFTESNYDVFNSVASPGDGVTQNYVRQIGPVGATSGGNYARLSFARGTSLIITALADPRAGIRATTGILPVERLDIPQQFVDQALSNLEISLRIGPVLTRIVPSPGQSDQPPPYPQSIVHPLPVEQNGTWSWWETDGAGGWIGHDLVNSTPNAQLGEATNTVREGCLQFVKNLARST